MEFYEIEAFCDRHELTLYQLTALIWGESESHKYRSRLYDYRSGKVKRIPQLMPQLLEYLDLCLTNGLVEHPGRKGH